MPVFIWEDPNASATYSSLLRRINTHLLTPTDDSTGWGLRVKVYRYRTDLKKPTEYDAIAEALEATLIQSDIMESIPQERSLFIASTCEDSSTVWAMLENGEYLKLVQTDMNQVEQIFVPKKDPDYRLRQTLKIEGRCLKLLQGEIKVGLVWLGSDPLAIWLEHGLNVDISDLLLKGHLKSHDGSSMLDYINCIRRELIE
jgi:hypothetical protein